MNTRKIKKEQAIKVLKRFGFKTLKNNKNFLITKENKSYITYVFSDGTVKTMIFDSLMLEKFDFEDMHLRPQGDNVYVLNRKNSSQKSIIDILFGISKQDIAFKNGNSFDFREENLTFKKQPKEVFWDLSEFGTSKTLISAIIADNPLQSERELIKTLSKLKRCKQKEAKKAVSILKSRNELGYYTETKMGEYDFLIYSPPEENIKEDKNEQRRAD